MGELNTYPNTKERLNELVTAVSTKTDLDEGTVRDLLTSGWRFVQELGKPDRWIKDTWVHDHTKVVGEFTLSPEATEEMIANPR